MVQEQDNYHTTIRLQLTPKSRRIFSLTCEAPGGFLGQLSRGDKRTAS